MKTYRGRPIGDLSPDERTEAYRQHAAASPMLTPMEPVHGEWLAVRCCCTPRKILGFMQVPQSDGRQIDVFTYDGERHTLEIRAAGMSRCTPTERLFFRERAIYSEERGLEFWRMVPGFVEAGKAGR